METHMTINRKKSYVEVLEILKYIDKKYIDKIPQNLINFFEENKDTNYKFTYDHKLELTKQKLNDNTLALLAMLNLNYWCENEIHKEELLRKYKENEIIYQEELRKKYDPNDIFRKKKQDVKDE